MDLNKESIFQIIETNNFFSLCSENSENREILDIIDALEIDSKYEYPKDIVIHNIISNIFITRNKDYLKIIEIIIGKFQINKNTGNFNEIEYTLMFIMKKIILYKKTLDSNSKDRYTKLETIINNFISELNKKSNNKNKHNNKLNSKLSSRLKFNKIRFNSSTNPSTKPNSSINHNPNPSTNTKPNSSTNSSTNTNSKSSTNFINNNNNNNNNNYNQYLERIHNYSYTSNNPDYTRNHIHIDETNNHDSRQIPNPNSKRIHTHSPISSSNIKPNYIDPSYINKYNHSHNHGPNLYNIKNHPTEQFNPSIIINQKKEKEKIKKQLTDHFLIEILKKKQEEQKEGIKELRNILKKGFKQKEEQILSKKEEQILSKNEKLLSNIYRLIHKDNNSHEESSSNQSQPNFNSLLIRSEKLLSSQNKEKKNKRLDEEQFKQKQELYKKEQKNIYNKEKKNQLNKLTEILKSIKKDKIYTDKILKYIENNPEEKLTEILKNNKNHKEYIPEISKYIKNISNIDKQEYINAQEKLKKISDGNEVERNIEQQLQEIDRKKKQKQLEQRNLHIKKKDILSKNAEIKTNLKGPLVPILKRGITIPIINKKNTTMPQLKRRKSENYKELLKRYSSQNYEQQSQQKRARKTLPTTITNQTIKRHSSQNYEQQSQQKRARTTLSTTITN